MLSEFQLEIIENDIKVSGIYMKTLSYDVLDHLCCMVEEKMSKGMTFEQAYEKSKEIFSPNGLSEIQEETQLLLNLNSKNMKKARNIIGITGLSLLIIGRLFAFNHLLGGGIMTVLGFGFALIYLFTHFKSRFLEEPTQQVKWLKQSAIFTAIFMLVGLCFYTMHWPGAKIMFGIGVVLALSVVTPLVVKNYNAAIKHLSGANVGVVLVFLICSTLVFFTSSNSYNFYTSLSNSDNEVISAREKIEEELTNKIESFEACVSYIESFKLACLDVEKVMVDRNTTIGVNTLIKNDIWKSVYRNEPASFNTEGIYQSLVGVNDYLTQKGINNTIPIESYEDWKKRVFNHQMLFGVFMYLDQIQLEVRKLEREVLLYHQS